MIVADLEIHDGSSGFYVIPMDSTKKGNAINNEKMWFERRKDAENQAMNLSKITGKAFGVVKLLSKCVPWHCPQAI